MTLLRETRVYDPPEPVGAHYAAVRAARFASGFTKVSLHDDGRIALIVCNDGDLLVLDVEAWRVETILDEDRQIIAREVVRPYIGPLGHVTLALTRDARHVIVVDAAHDVLLLERRGRVRWRRRLAKPPKPVGTVSDADWEWNRPEACDEGDLVRVLATWTRHLMREGDGNDVWEDVFVTTKLRASTGEIVFEQSHATGPPSPAYAYTLYGDDLYIERERVRLDDGFGRVHFVTFTPDKARCLVATREGGLILLDRR